MKTLFPVLPVDRAFYQARLKDFLPDKLIDIHSHVWLDRFIRPQPSAPLRVVTWPSRVAKDNSIEDLRETYRLMFPGKEVKAMIFSLLGPNDDFDTANAYVSQAAKQAGFPALLFARPDWSEEEFERRIQEGGFYGCKVYLSLSPSYLPEKEIRIFDFLPHHFLRVLDRHGWIVMLHIPRDGRLGDPVNLAQILEIEQRYPNVKLIIAHVGRAYCPQDVGNAFQVLKKTRRMVFDFSANTNQQVFEQLIRTIGPKRILFGSDLPILRMRTRRVCENGHYVNIVPKGLYGDVSDDPHMRETEGADADQLTFFMYEEIDSFRRAAEATGLNRTDVEDIFYQNARRLVNAVRPIF